MTFDWRDRRLVGIVGPIGAGKSSILDAIAFALYGKTPGVGSATRVADPPALRRGPRRAHASRSTGRSWRAVRAPRRKGQSGHQLVRLASDDADAEALETITQEGPVNERVEQLLGMDFQTFCRSVLLAQNRFSDFLKRDAGPSATRCSRACSATSGSTRRRRPRSGASIGRRVALESLARERTTIDEARRRLDDARARAQAAEREVKAIDGAAPEMSSARRRAPLGRADAAAAAQQLETARAGRVDAARRRPGRRPARDGRRRAR